MLLMLLVIYLRPMYFSFIIIFTSLGNCYSLIYLINVRKTTHYYGISFKESILGFDNVIDAWISYSKLIAAKRVYAFLQKKKIDLVSIAFFILIYTFEIPFIFLNVFYKVFIKNKGSALEGMRLMC